MKETLSQLKSLLDFLALHHASITGKLSEADKQYHRQKNKTE